MPGAKHTPTPGPWFVSGVRFRMNGGEWHSVNRYNEATKQDENIACVGFDARTGAGFADAHMIAATPDLYRELCESRCPRPANHRPDDLTVSACIDAKECGCSAGEAIIKARLR